MNRRRLMGAASGGGAQPVFIDYIQGDGVAAFIDTGFPLKNDVFSWEVAIGLVNNSLYGGLGRANSSNVTTERFQIEYYQNKFLIGIGGSMHYTQLSSTSDYNKFYLERTGKYIFNDSTTGTLVGLTSDLHIYLLARNWLRDGTPQSFFPCSSKFFYSILRNENGDVIQDLRPCIYCGKYGMWDMVSNKFFGNSGGGTITGKTFEEQYQRVEYIEVAQEQRVLGIDTGLNFTPRFEFVAYLRSSQPNVLLGNDMNSRVERYSASNPVWQIYGYATNALVTEKHLVSYRKNNLYIDNVFIASFAAPSYNKTCYIFSEGGTTIYRAVLEKIKFYDVEDNLVRDFCPCRRKSDDKHGLYDFVERKFYPTYFTTKIGSDVN